VVESKAGAVMGFKVFQIRELHTKEIVDSRGKNKKRRALQAAVFKNERFSNIINRCVAVGATVNLGNYKTGGRVTAIKKTRVRIKV
jgi:hypothetical protein